MLVNLILTVSVLLQFSAAFFAFRLVKVTGKAWAWILISAALFFMGIRRLITLSYIIFIPGSHVHADDLATEIVSLLLSFLLFFGVIKIRPIFMKHKLAEERTRKLNRMLAMLSDINQTIVRIHDLQVLFERACKIAVEKGNFPMTWIGLLDDLTQTIEPVASAGKSGEYLEKINISLKSEPRTYCSVDCAMRKGKYVICNSIEPDDNPAPCRKIAHELGFYSCSSFPLNVFGNIRGTINFYAGDPHFFDEEEIKLLDELAMDISFAMEFAEKEEERKSAEREIVIRNRILNVFQTSVTDEEMYNEMLSVVLETMESKYGVVGYIDENGALVVPSMSGNILDKWQVPDKTLIFERDKWGNSSWYSAIRDKKFNFINEPVALTPEGQIVIIRHISMPVIFQDEVIGLILIANKDTDYTEKDVQLLDLIANHIIAPVLNAGLQRDKQEKARKLAENEVQKLNKELEQKVIDRTNELARGRNMLRTLIDSLPDEIYAKNSESRFIMANYPILHTFGLSVFEDILGKTDFDLMPKEEAMKAYEKEHSVLQHDGQMINYEDHLINTDGKIRWLAVTKVPMRDKDGNITGLVGINRDITYFKESEETLKKAKEAAEAANLAKSTFLSNMSHEIRTPLNAILGFSQLMQSDDEINKEHVKWLEIINRSGEHLLALINDILEVSRIEAGRITFNPSNFDLFSLLKDIEAMFRVKTDSKNLSLLFEYSDDLPKYVVTDEGKLRQIIINLAGNSVKFTREGGIALRARVKNEKDKIRLITEIEDTGPGIAEKDINKLFRKFGQTETGIKEGGTGLGLAISQQYAKILGGKITVKSKVGEGTCFILTIGIENGKELVKEEDQKKRVTGLKPGQKPYRILIADDRTDNRELLKTLLTSAGFEIEEAQNGSEAIAKFKIWSPDLILMDVRMPVMDGYEAIRGIRAIEEKKTPIIAVTASAFQEDRQKARETGADGYLRKPFKEYELFECIESCLGFQYVYG